MGHGGYTLELSLKDSVSAGLKDMGRALSNVRELVGSLRADVSALNKESGQAVSGLDLGKLAEGAADPVLHRQARGIEPETPFMPPPAPVAQRSTIRQGTAARPAREEEARQARHLVLAVEFHRVVPGGAGQRRRPPGRAGRRVVGAGAAIPQQSDIAVPEVQMQQVRLGGTEAQRRAGAQEEAQAWGPHAQPAFAAPGAGGIGWALPLRTTPPKA